MKRAFPERSMVVVLFVLVLVVFSFAARDSKKLAQLYTKSVAKKVQKPSDYTASSVEDQPLQPKITRN